MTAFRSLLNDEELAAVLTFVRNTWGNKASVVRPESVKKIRQETIQRSTFWKPDELLAEHPLEASLAVNVPATAEFSNESLEKELLNTSVAELAAVAMDRGNVERGKKVFYQSAAACFACHDPPGGTALLGPDLTKLTSKLTGEQLVESVLYPSKLIEKDFAQISVLTVDGKVQTGIRISENDKEIILRNLAEPEPIKIAQDDIEAVTESKVSLMPEQLTRQLKTRKEFDDLIRYIIEIRKR